MRAIHAFLHAMIFPIGDIILVVRILHVLLEDPFFVYKVQLLTNAVKTQSNYLAFITIINQTVIQIRMSMLCPFSRSLCLSTCTHKTFISRLIKILKSRYRPPEMQLQPKRDFAYKSRVNAVC